MSAVTTTALRRSSTLLTLVAVLALLQLGTTRAHATDWGKVLGAVAAGYVTYQVLDGLSDSRAAVRHYTPNPRYNPPPSYYDGGEARYWYQEGYSDGFNDGTDYGRRQGFDQGYRVGYRDGDRAGYQRGVGTGYRIGYGDGYGDGHRDGFIEGIRVPPRRR